MNPLTRWLLIRRYHWHRRAGTAEAPGWDVAELRTINADLAKPSDAEYAARAIALMEEMNRERAERRWWLDDPVPAAALPSLDGLPEAPAEPAPKPVRVRASRVKKAAG